MAEWIKLQEKIIRDPVVIDQSERLSLDPRIIAWSWVTLWDWAREQTEDGFVARMTPARIDGIVNIKGFADHAGEWLEWRDGGVLFPKWDTHNSRGAKERAVNARRNKKHRAKAARDGRVTVPPSRNRCTGDDTRDAPVTVPPSPEEKRREEKRIHQHQDTPSGDGGGGEEADSRRKALKAAGINPGPVLDELTATILRPSQIGMIAQEVKSRGGKGGVLVSALREAASKPPVPLPTHAPALTSPEAPVDPETEKQALRARLETTQGTTARRIIEKRLAELEGAA